MNISAKGVDFIKNEEKFMSKPYLDSVGVATIGYGSTIYLDGTKVTLKDKPITEKQATELLNLKLSRQYVPAVNKALKRVINQNQFDALVSLCYNIGTGGLAQSTLIKTVNEDPCSKQIPYWFSVWNKGTINGKKVELKGLTLRRAREAKLYFS